MGRTCSHWIGARGSSGLESTTFNWTRRAAARRAAVWTVKERRRVERRRGCRAREKWMKKMLLARKTTRAIRDLAQR